MMVEEEQCGWDDVCEVVVKVECCVGEFNLELDEFCSQLEQVYV